MPKSADAFRTISEVADWLGIQAHVLRFWESKFTQVRPVKRAGGRRYYRPNDMLLLGGIKQLLHEDGLTIKGVQKILREEGMGHVAAMSQPLDELTQSLLDETPPTPFVEAPEEPKEETGVVLSFDKKPPQPEKTQEIEVPVEVAPVVSSPVAPASEEAVQPEETAQVDAEPVAKEAAPDAIVETAAHAAPETSTASDVDEGAAPLAEAAANVAPPQSDGEHPPEKADERPAAEPQEVAAAGAKAEPEDLPDPETDTGVEPEAVNEHITIVEPAPIPRPDPTFEDVPLVADEIPPKPEAAETDSDAAPAPQDASDPQQQPENTPAVAATPSEPADEPATEAATLPAFLRRPMAEEQPAPLDNPPADTQETADEAAGAAEDAPPPEPPAPKPRIIETPALTPEHEISAAPAILAIAYRSRQLSTAQAREIAPLLEKLTILRDSMASPRAGATPATIPTPSND